MSKVTVTAYAEGRVYGSPSAIKMYSGFVPLRAVIKSNRDVCRSVRDVYFPDWFLGTCGCELWVPVSALGELMTPLVVNHQTQRYRKVIPGEVEVLGPSTVV